MGRRQASVLALLRVTRRIPSRLYVQAALTEVRNVSPPSPPAPSPFPSPFLSLLRLCFLPLFRDDTPPCRCATERTHTICGLSRTLSVPRAVAVLLLLLSQCSK